jgi:hypothetical protein
MWDACAWVDQLALAPQQHVDAQIPGAPLLKKATLTDCTLSLVLKTKPPSKNATTEQEWRNGQFHAVLTADERPLPGKLCSRHECLQLAGLRHPLRESERLQSVADARAASSWTAHGPDSALRGLLSSSRVSHRCGRETVRIAETEWRKSRPQGEPHGRLKAT